VINNRVSDNNLIRPPNDDLNDVSSDIPRLPSIHNIDNINEVINETINENNN
jgi:hypothetical protein